MSRLAFVNLSLRILPDLPKYLFGTQGSRCTMVNQIFKVEVLFQLHRFWCHWGRTLESAQQLWCRVRGPTVTTSDSHGVVCSRCWAASVWVYSCLFLSDLLLSKTCVEYFVDCGATLKRYFFCQLVNSDNQSTVTTEL